MISYYVINPDVVSIDLSDIYKYRGVIGIAEGMRYDIIFVRIDRRFWRSSTIQQKRSLIFHELCHDMFDLEHGSINLMNPKLENITKQEFELQKIELIKYLKNEQI